MIKTLLILLLCSAALSMYGQSADSLSVNNIDGSSVSLLSYQGHKILFLIAPARLSDSTKLNELASFNSRYGDTVKLVGIMSKEDGYVDSNKTKIKTMYQNKGINILLTEGMFTKKGSGANQGSLMQWLTKQSLNKRFDEDTKGVGQKFFADENGKLFSVLIPETRLFSPAVDRNIYRK